MAATITPLISGIRGCESGTVTIYQRGTTNPATVYTDFDLTGGTTGASGVHSLDANGGIELYSAEPLRIIAKDSAGATVRDFIWEDAAGAVTVQQTGYNGGAVTNVKEVLADLYTSLGAADGQVLYNGVATNISSALKAAAFAQFNVAGYGAVGNGIANDRTAIQNAINAAEAAGGGIVYIGPGTYNIDSSLTIDSANVSVFCVGGPIIQLTAVAGPAFSISSVGVYIEGATVRMADAAGANNSAAAGFYLAGASNSKLINCTVQHGVTSYLFGYGVYLVDSSFVTIQGCSLRATTYAIYMDATSFSTDNRITDTYALSDGTGVLYLVDQRYLKMSGLYVDRLGSGSPYDIDAYNCDWVTLVNSDLVFGGIRTDSNCSHWYESGCYINGYSAIVTSGGNMNFRDAPPEGPDIASAGALTLTRAPMHSVYTVTGTTTITSIATTGIPEGYRVTLIFSGALTFTDGSNLKLAGNLVTTADDSITLVYKDSFWVEEGRSVN
jgi:hypothetical protein